MKRTSHRLASVCLIAKSIWLEAVRQHLPLILLAGILLMGAGAWLSRDLNFGLSEPRFLLDVGFGTTAFFGAILAVIAPAQFFFSEIERRTILVTLAHPIRRAEFILGQFSGVMLVLLAYCGSMTICLGGLLWWHDGSQATAPYDALTAGWRPAYGNLALCGLIQWFKLGVLAALTLMVASYARSTLFTVATGFGALAICQLQHVARDFYAATDWSWATGGLRLISWLFPDFSLFEVSGNVATGATLSVGVIGCIALYASVYMAVFNTLAICSFSQREL